MVNFGFHPPYNPHQAISPTKVLSHWHPQQRAHSSKSVTSLSVCRNILLIRNNVTHLNLYHLYFNFYFMASILRDNVATASAELRAAVEHLKVCKDKDPESVTLAQQQVDEKKAALLSVVRNIADVKEEQTTSTNAHQPPVENVCSTNKAGETHIQMAIDSSQYHSIKIVPKPDEMNDLNFPPSLLAAMELFSKVQMLIQGRELQTSVETFCHLLESGPPVEAVSMGMACICWSCGHAGLPANVGEVTKKAPATATREMLSKAPIAVCSNCSGKEQTNLIRVTQPDGSMIPWIESKTEQKKKAEVAREKMMASLGTEEKEQQKQQPKKDGKAGSKKIKPNAPCFCGSGKKFKKCCR